MNNQIKSNLRIPLLLSLTLLSYWAKGQTSYGGATGVNHETYVINKDRKFFNTMLRLHNGASSSVGNRAWNLRNHAGELVFSRSTSSDFSDLGDESLRLSGDGDLTIRGKYVVQNMQNGGEGRGIYMWSGASTNWGIYMGQSGAGRSLSGGSAVAGVGFSSHAIRFRAYDQNSRGFIWENSSEELLMSLNSGSGRFDLKGDLHADGDLNALGNINASSFNGKYVVQNGQDGGPGKGIYMSHGDNTDWAIYMASQGSGKSINGGEAVSGGEGLVFEAIRFRARDLLRRGFIWENSSEELLMSLSADLGRLELVGDLHANKLYGDGSNLTGIIATSVAENIDLTTSGEVDFSGGGKYVVQNGQNGGAGNGIYLWSGTSTNWGIYMGESGEERAFNGGSAVSGPGGIDSHAIRFRATNVDNKGFIWENSSNQHLMSLNSGTGRLDLAGDLHARSFHGDGANLTGVVASELVSQTGSLSFDDNNIKLGLNAGEDITATGKHIFIGHETGKNSAFQAVSLIDYTDDTDANVMSGEDFLETNSVFVLNNHSNLKRPLLFGKFAKYNEQNGTYTDEGNRYNYPQLGINTHHLVDGTALTVSGAVHIGPEDLDPSSFPSGSSYDDALLWVEKGIVTENMYYVPNGAWDEWPDYVFKKDYKLLKLEELEKFVKENQHLPGMVSEKEVMEDGFEATAMTMKMLEKIEELTLYAIAQDKVSANQARTIEELLIRIEKLESVLGK